MMYHQHLIGVSARQGAIMHVIEALERTSGWINDGLVKLYIERNHEGFVAIRYPSLH
jgi:hypothetical protein